MFGGFNQKNRCPIGLDMGTRVIRLLQFERRGEGLAVVDAAEQSLPTGLSTDSPERDAACVDAIRAMLDAGSFAGRQVVSALPAGAIQYKNLRLPRMPADELRAAVEWEASDRLRFTPDAMRIEFLDAGEVRQGDEVREEIILLAVPHAAVERHLDILLNSGLTPVAIDATPASLARSLRGCGSDLESPAQVVVDLGHTRTKVLIARNGRVLFFKPIEIGGAKLDQAVAQKLNLEPHDAADLRKRVCSTKPVQSSETPATADPAERAVFESVRTLAGEIAKELALCLRYYSVTFRGRRPESIKLSGGGANDPTLAHILADGAGIPVEPNKPFEGIDTSRAALLQASGDTFAAWSNAAGLSLRPAERAAKRGAA